MNHPLQDISFVTSNYAVAIEASAGTGKTWTIERLYIKALLEGSLSQDNTLPLGVENILVVTFTNDATNELKQRIGEQISDTITKLLYIRNNTNLVNLPEDIFIDYLKNRPYLDKDITLLVRALQNFDNAAIFTIHGLCNRILKNYQFECKISSVFELVSSRQNIIHKLVRDYFRIKVFNNQELATDKVTFIDNIRKLFDSKNEQYDLDIVELVAAKLPRDLFSLVDGEYVIKYDLTVSDAGNSGLLSEKEQLALAKSEFLADLIKYIAQHYSNELAYTKEVSFDEIIQLVANNLKSSKTLADTLYTQYPLAFIDEFQDTDDLQWQIFSNIYHLKGTSCRGNLVVVGDPKQAIYSFRGADIDTYLEARNVINNTLELTRNYRSHVNIMNFLNQLFSLPNQNCTADNSYLGYGINYTAVEAKGKGAISLPSADKITQYLLHHGLDIPVYTEEVQLVSIVGKDSNQRNKRLLNALTFEILTLLNVAPLLKGKIAILVEKNAQATQLVTHLRQFGIKAIELKLGNIFATDTAKSLYQVLLVCLDLAKRRELIRALSSRLFNLNLASLYTVEDENNPLIEYWLQRFYVYKQIWQKNSVIALVYALLEDIINWHKNSNKAIFTNRELANLFQLAELINKHAQKLSNQVELVNWLHTKITDSTMRLIDDIDGENEELVRLDNDDEQIIITTQHRAKGLEYEILFCPYFKSSIKLDGEFDFNYRRPLFASYRRDKHKYSQMIMDTEIGEMVVNNANQETHRLNYVALTRAKSRIYIYLSNVTKSKNAYHTKVRPSKAYDLFGFNSQDNSDTSHRLFNYPEFFGSNPMLALKAGHNFTGVIAYQRSNIADKDLQKIALTNQDTHILATPISNFPHGFGDIAKYSRQSYSGIMYGNSEVMNDWFVKNEVTNHQELEYRFKVLHDKDLKGATFGTVFHGLCEIYPATTMQIDEHLKANNVKINSLDYIDEFKQMIDETFNYHLFAKVSLGSIKHKLHELEFNLTIANSLNLNQHLYKLMVQYYGANHPFTQASKLLGKVDNGFLNGFIDLFFELDGKYWVLDYKTNRLANYHGAKAEDATGDIIASMSEHHYYLQYLLYLVAIKRYLEFKLGVDDASDLLGGAIYYYVRGVFTTVNQPYDGVFIDDKCQAIIGDLDKLLKGSLLC